VVKTLLALAALVLAVGVLYGNAAQYMTDQANGAPFHFTLTIPQ